MNGYEPCLRLPTPMPLYACTTDQLTGCLPAASQGGEAWYWMHALELAVLGTQITVHNAGWRANPCLQTVELPLQLPLQLSLQGDCAGGTATSTANTGTNAGEKVLAQVLAWLGAGTYVSFCGALPLADNAACRTGRLSHLLPTVTPPSGARCSNARFGEPQRGRPARTVTPRFTPPQISESQISAPPPGTLSIGSRRSGAPLPGILQAGVLYGAWNARLAVLFCDGDGLLRRMTIPFASLVSAAENGDLRVLRGVRLGRSVAFVPAVAAQSLARLLTLPDRAEALRLLCSGHAEPVAWRTLRQQRLAVSRALAGLGADPALRQAYLARVLVPFQTLAAQVQGQADLCARPDATRLRWIWDAEGEILARAVALLSTEIRPICRAGSVEKANNLPK